MFQFKNKLTVSYKTTTDSGVKL